MKTLVSAAEMEEVGENIILKYLDRRKYPPRCIDIEGLIQDFLHLRIEYAVIADRDFDKVTTPCFLCSAKQDSNTSGLGGL